jgi:hypothetical protein
VPLEMSRKSVLAAFIAGRAARIILAGSNPADAPDNAANQVSDIIVSNLVVREDASNGLVGYLYAIGTTAPVVFTITSDPDGIFAIVNGNELHKADAFGTGADYAITIKATETASGAEYSEEFTIDVIPVADEEDDSGIGGGGGSGDVEIPDDEDPDADTDPYVEPPVEVVTEVAAKVSGKTGGTSVFLKDWGVPVGGRVYVMKYSADWSGMSALGAYAAVGFGFKQGNSFHMIGLRGNGAVSTTMLASRLYGDWRKSKQFTITNDGTATHGTKNGPNWLRLTIAGDGTTYTLESSADGATWAAELAGAAPSPLTDTENATQFGPAAYFYEEDKGPFVISISEFWQKPVNTVAPVITGTPTEGETLTLSNTGTWTGYGITYTQQWKADGAAISGETGTTIVLSEDEVDTDITCDVTATNPGGATTQASNTLGPVEAAGVDFNDGVWTFSFASSSDGNQLTDANAGAAGYAQKLFPTVAGTGYELSVYIVQDAVPVSTRHPLVAIDLASDAFVWTASDSASITVNTPGDLGGWGVDDLGATLRYWMRFQATASTTQVRIAPANGFSAATNVGITGTATYEDVTLEELVETGSIDFSTWTKINSAGWTKNTIKDNNATGYGGAQKDFATTTVPHEVSLTVLKDSNTGRRARLLFGFGGTFGGMWFRTDTGVISGATNYTSTGVEDLGTHWRIWGRLTPAGTTSTVIIYPSVGNNSGSDFVASLTDSMTCGELTVTVV